MPKINGGFFSAFFGVFYPGVFNGDFFEFLSRNKPPRHFVPPLRRGELRPRRYESQQPYSAAEGNLDRNGMGVAAPSVVKGNLPHDGNAPMPTAPGAGGVIACDDGGWG